MTDSVDSQPASLTQQEAEERAALLSVRRYDIAVDLTGLLDGDTVESVSTVTFDCTSPGGSTFVDCVTDIRHATLNGRELDLATVSRGRLPLTDLAEENVLVVAAAQSDTSSSAGILRTVDPSDKLVYVWMSFEADDARRIWACFDQPDLKAPHAFTVTAPESWTVTSNGAPDSVAPAGDAARVWTFPDTPSLSTYVVVINAGPFHELRREVGGHSLGLYSRQSTAAFLDRDADELFDLTARGLAFFGERFGMPFPQERYDQVFVPNMGGAMENWGCVTWTDGELYRTPPTYGERSFRAWVLLHEMAHMWFGDLVTMQWWDDLWLNEAFASWAATWCALNATEFTDGWATFLALQKVNGYRQDLSPASHPIRGTVPDVAMAMANFDAITYMKGESVLKQLVAHVGEEAFVTGLRAYFRDNAWGNTRLDDLIDAVAEASGRDLADWTRLWFDRAGTDTIALELTDGGGRLVVSAPDGEPRPHTLLVGSYRSTADGLERVATAEVETSGDAADIELPAADLHLVNDDDLTFAAARTDPASLEVLLEGAGGIPSPLSRAVAVVTAWDMLVKHELTAAAFLTCVLGVLRTERVPGVVDPFLGLAVRAAEAWSPAAEVAGARSAVADVAALLTEVPDLRLEALQTLASTATTPEHFEVLAAAGDDPDLAWRVLVRRAELGDHDPDAVRALVERDPDPEAADRALTVRAALPDAEAKEEAWNAMFRDRSVHAGTPQGRVADAFWRPGQDELLLPFAARYLDELRALGHGGMLELGSLAGAMQPRTADDAYLARARDLADSPDTWPMIRTVLLSNVDTLTRQLRARSLPS
ncbi:MAG: aminopeptidase N [Nocardioidaceae bacterium]